MEGASLDTKAMENWRGSVEEENKWRKFCGYGQLGDESLEGDDANLQERASSFLEKKLNEKLDQYAENSTTFH